MGGGGGDALSGAAMDAAGVMAGGQGAQMHDSAAGMPGQDQSYTYGSQHQHPSQHQPQSAMGEGATVKRQKMTGGDSMPPGMQSLHEAGMQSTRQMEYGSGAAKDGANTPGGAADLATLASAAAVAEATSSTQTTAAVSGSHTMTTPAMAGVPGTAPSAAEPVVKTQDESTIAV